MSSSLVRRCALLVMLYAPMADRLAAQYSPRDQQILQALKMTGETIDKIKANNQAAEAARSAEANRREQEQKAREQAAMLERSRRMNEDFRALAAGMRRVLDFQPPAEYRERLVFHQRLLREGDRFAPLIELDARSKSAMGVIFSPAGDIAAFRNQNGNITLCFLQDGGRQLELPVAMDRMIIRLGRSTIALRRDNWTAIYDFEGRLLERSAEEVAAALAAAPDPQVAPEHAAWVDFEGSRLDNAVRFKASETGPAWRHQPNPSRIAPTDVGRVNHVWLSATPRLVAVGLGLSLNEERNFTYSTDVVDVDARAPVQNYPGFLVPNGAFTFTLAPSWTGEARRIWLWAIDAAHDLQHAKALATDDYETNAQYRARVSGLNLIQRLRLKIGKYDAEEGVLLLEWRGLPCSLRLPADQARKLAGRAFVEVQGTIRPIDKVFLELGEVQLRMPDGRWVEIPPSPARPAPPPGTAVAAQASGSAAAAPKTSPTVPAAAVSSDEFVTALNRLQELRRTGLLTEEEYKARRDALVERLP